MILVSSLVTSLQKELGSFNSTEQFPDMYRYISSAVNYVFNYRDWDWNRYTATIAYTTANTEQQMGFYPFKVFYVNNGTEVSVPVDKETWFITVDKTNLICTYRDILLAGATGNYELLYSKTAPVVTSATTEIDMPDYYKDVINIIAIHFAKKDIQDYQTASALIGQANAILNSATERSVNTLPRSTVRLGSNHSF